jgi:hypothetical protein
MYTLRAECRVCTTQETHYFSTTKPNRLMLFWEKFAVYCEKYTKHTDTLCGGRMQSLYLTGNTLRLRYKSQPVNAVWEKFTVYCENHTEHTDTLCGQNAEFVPHRKHITCPLQSPTC